MTASPQYLKRMIVSAINSRELESTRLSRLLHDEVGQVLSAVGLQLDVLKLDFRSQVPDISERVHEIQKMLDQAVGQVRALSYDLNPSIVERAGLCAALQRLVERTRGSFPGVIRLNYDSTFRVPHDIGHAWYRIAELAVENAVQHAKATSVDVSVRHTKRHSMLEVRDNGQGFSPEDASTVSPGLRLLLMEHYATQFPIRVVLKSKPASGTLVRSTWSRRGAL